MEIAAVVVAIAAALFAGLSWWQSRRSANASEASALDSRQMRLHSTTPEFELTAYFHRTDGPSADLRLLSADLDRVVVELINSPHWSRTPGPWIMGLTTNSGLSGERVDLGPLRLGEQQHMQVGYQGFLDGITLRVGCECFRGEDRWTVLLSSEFPMTRDPRSLPTNHPRSPYYHRKAF